MKRIIASFLLALALLAGPVAAQQHGWGFNTGADPSITLPQTLTLVSAFSTAPTATRKTLINTLINTAVVCGAWDRLDVLYVLAAADSQAASLNWKNPAAFTLTTTGTPTFTADRGYAGNGTDATLVTGYNPQSASLGIAQNDAHGAIFMLNSTASNSFDMNSDNGRLRIRGRFTTGQPNVNVSNNANTVSGGSTPAPDYVIGTRSDGTNQTNIVNGGSQVTTTAQASSALTQGVTFLGNTAQAQWSDRTIMVAHVGRNLTLQHAACLYNGFNTYLHAIGAT